MDPQTVQEIKPLVIKTPDGNIVDVSLMNRKCHSKSIERDQLWHLHRETGRTLPYDERAQLLDLKARETWYEAVINLLTQDSGQDSLSAENRFTGPAAQNNKAKEVEAQKAEEEQLRSQPASLRKSASESYLKSPHHDQAPEEESVSGTTYGQDNSLVDSESGKAVSSQSCGPILEKLEAIVRERRFTMPEGSYTTHLFSSGAEKIRKKAGEEAVELILADSRDQIIYEAADLLYHLCVLLVSEDISYSEVCSELQQRHTQE